MERRNWPGWAALVLAGLALFVALGARGEGFVQRKTMPALGERWQGAPEPDRAAPSFGPQADRFAQSDRFDRRGFDDHHFGHGRHHGGWFGPFALLFRLGQLVALGGLVWLLWRAFQIRRDGSPPTAGTGTAGPPNPSVE